MSSKGKSIRRVDVDIARAFSLLLVVYGHALQMFFFDRPEMGDAFGQWKFMTNFVVVFYMISGMIYRPKPLREIVTSSLTLLFIAYLVHVVGWFLQLALGLGDPTWRTLIGPLVKNWNFSVVSVWFLVSLAFIQVLYHLVVTGGWAVRVAAGVVVIGGFLTSQLWQIYSFQLGTLLPGLAFYGLGHWLSRFPMIKRRWWVFLAMIAGAFAGVALLSPLNGGCTFNATGHCGFPSFNGAFAVWLMFGEIGFIPAYLPSAVLGCLGMLWIAQFIASYGGRFLNNALTQVGNMTLDLLILNGVVLCFIQPYLERIIPDNMDGLPVTACAVGLTLLQVLVLPLAAKATRPILGQAQMLARMVMAWPAAIVDDIKARRASVAMRD